MKDGLISIYLYHAKPFPNRLAELQCHAHTNLVGSNAAGKTTMLNLIPIFYGIEPSKIISTESNKLSFVDFYLPHAASVLAFEYLKNGESKLAVVYRNGRSHEYRFVSGAARDVLFCEEGLAKLNELQDANQWLMSYIKPLTSVSSQVKSVKEYQAILYNAQRVLRERKHLRAGLQATAHEFALCGQSFEMKHIAAISSVLMNKQDLLGNFKRMIIDSFLQDQISIDSSPYSEGDKEQISSISSLIEIQEKTSSSKSAIEAIDALKETWHRFEAYRDSLEVRRITAEKRVSELQVHLASMEDAEAKEAEQFRVTNGELLSELSRVTHELTSLDKRIEALHEKRAFWDDEFDISFKKAELSNLGQLLDDLSAAEAHYKQLIEAVQRDKEQHDAQITRLRLDAAKTEKQQNDKLNAIKERQRQEESRQGTEIRSIEKQQQAEIEAHDNERRITQGRLTKAVIEHQAALTLAQRPTESEELQLKAFTERHEDLDRELELVDDQLGEAATNQEALKSEQSDLKLRQSRKVTEYDAAEKELQHIRKQLYPDDATLRAYLKREYAGWESTIGKVIAPSLLNEKGLEPDWNDGGRHTLFGLTLNLDMIAIPPHALSDAQLQEKLELKQRELKLIQGELDKIKSQLQDIEKRLQVKESERQKIARGKAELIKQKGSNRIAREQCEQTIKTAIEQRMSAMQEVLNAAEEQLKKYDEETARIREAMTKNHHNYLMARKAEFSSITASIKEEAKAILAAMKESADGYKTQERELNDQFKRLLQDKGVDGRAEADAKERVTALKARIDAINKSRQRLQEYEEWVSTAWTSLQELEAKEQQTKRDKIQLETKQSECEEQYLQAVKDFNAKCKTLQGDIKVQSGLIISLEQATNKVEKGLEDTLPETVYAGDAGEPVQTHGGVTAPEHLNVDQIVEAVNDDIQNARQLRRRVKAGPGEVMRVLNKYPESTLYRDWYNRLADIDQKFTGLTEDVRQLCEVEYALKGFLTEDIPAAIDVVLNFIEAAGVKYSRCFQTLTIIRNKVRAVSRTLNEVIDTENNFPALTDIKIELESRVEQLELWDSLSAFNAHWEQRSELGEKGLPDKAFLESLTTTVANFKTGGIQIGNFETMVRLKLSMKENGRHTEISNSAGLAKVSSTGCSMLALIVVFAGMTRYLCPDPDVTIHWPVDELGTLDDSNQELLFEFMSAHNITLFTAQPTMNAAMRRHFALKYEVVSKTGFRKFIPGGNQGGNPLIEATHNALAEVSHAE